MTFNIDVAIPASPSVTASATSYSTIHLNWPPVVPTPSGLAAYDVYKNGAFLASVTDPYIDAVGLSQGTTYSFVVYARNGAGTLSPASEPASATTPATALPSAPTTVFAKAPAGNYAFVNWSPSGDTSGTVSYHVWRSENGVDFSAIATTTGGVDDSALIDSTLSSSTRYWYAVSTDRPARRKPAVIDRRLRMGEHLNNDDRAAAGRRPGCSRVFGDRGAELAALYQPGYHRLSRDARRRQSRHSDRTHVGADDRYRVLRPHGPERRAVLLLGGGSRRVGRRGGRLTRNPGPPARRA